MHTFTNARILITGGLGFIGSNLAICLAQKGAKVTIIDNLMPEYGGNLFNIHGFKNKLDVHILDIRDIHTMKQYVKNQDILFNLAGQTSHMDSMQDPYTDLDINCKAQLSILEACMTVNPSIQIIFAGTRQIYGKPNYLPVDETHPIQPVDINGIHKIAGEWYHMLYHTVYGLNTCVIRLTNTIGPRMRIRDARQTFLGVWIKHILCNEPFEVWDGEQLRDFTYIDDCVEAFMLAAENRDSCGKIFNIGGTPPVSLKNLAQLLVEIAKEGTYRIKDYPSNRKKIDIGNYYADDTYIRNVLGWKPSTDLQTALKNTIMYYRPVLNKYI